MDKQKHAIASVGFVHLHLHSEYSLRDGLVRLKPLVNRAVELNMPAVAVTELDNLFSVVKFYKYALEAGIKPIVGCDLSIRGARSDSGVSKIVLLAMSRDGYRNLSKLITAAYRNQRAGEPVAVEREWIDEWSQDLIAICPGLRGDVGQALVAGREPDAQARMDGWLRSFGDRFYLGVSRTGRANEEQCLQSSCDIASINSVPIVASNDVRFLLCEDFEAHEARVCIHEGRSLADPRRPRIYSKEQYLRSPQEMSSLFQDLPGALENSVQIAKRCNVELQLGKNFLPEFPVPPGQTMEELLEEQSRAGLAQRLAQHSKRTKADQDRALLTYEARLAQELKVINGMGFPGYFLIVADFIRWAKENEIPVGPGRGSGAGSLVAYCLNITDLDPIAYDLLFERFLNPERVSMPDFDVDFCMDNRDRVIEYVSKRYGSDSVDSERVSQIITFGTMAAKAVVRDVGRVLGHPFGFVDQLAKLVPFELGITLEQALQKEDLLRFRYDGEEDVRTLIDLALKLEGIARNAGKHAGGVVISPTALTDFTPLYKEPGAGFVTQFDMKDIESVGLVKFDFLGLRTLTIIDWAVKAINKARARCELPVLDIVEIPLDDVYTFDLIKRACTTAVFQLESRGMKDLIRRLTPDCFDDIIALVALFRPGPLQSGMVDDFIDRKHGRAEVQYPHPSLEKILSPTYGVILYQEQVMQIAQELSGYTLGEADLLRRAMGKKLPSEMAIQREIFETGAAKRGVDESLSGYIFDLIEKFAGYGFNKSHSAAYALISYQTAWLKAHYPAEFMAAVMTADMDNTDKVTTLFDECHELGLRVQPPNVNLCASTFLAADEKTVLYGLGAIKGVGSSAVEAIVNERERAGPYLDLFEFCRRVDSRRVNRRVFEALLRSGALDDLGPSRAAMMRALTLALQAAEQVSRNLSSGQNDLFSTESNAQVVPPRFDSVDEWPDEVRLLGERETIGVYMSGHPVDRYEDVLGRIVSIRLGQLKPNRRESHTVAGLVIGLRIRQGDRGKQASVTLDDRTGRIEVFVGDKTLEQCGDLLARDKILVIEGWVRTRESDNSVTMNASRVEDFVQARQSHAKHIVLRLHRDRMNMDTINKLKEALIPYRQGPLPVCMELRRDDASGRVKLGAEWSVKLSDDLISRLGAVIGDSQVEVEYR